MIINLINNQQNILFKSKIRGTSTLGFGVNRAIELGDKGFFNAIRHLASDGLNRDILIGGSNGASKKNISSTVRLTSENLEYTLSKTQPKDKGLNSFQLMGENVIEIVKRLAIATGNISKEALNAKSIPDTLLKECNELYRTIFVG